MSDICYRCQYYDEVYDPDTGDEYIHCSAGDNTDIPANCPEKESEEQEANRMKTSEMLSGRSVKKMTQNDYDTLADLLDKVWMRGYNEGKDEAYKSPVPTQDAYNNGARDAWECVKSIIIECYGLRESIFDGNSSVISILKKYSPLEAIERVNKYKEKQEYIEKVLRPGDEVYFLDENYTRVVTSVFLDSGGDLKAVQISKNGKYCVDKVSLLKKTGRHFDAIEEVLEQMKGVKDYDG